MGHRQGAPRIKHVAEHQQDGDRGQDQGQAPEPAAAGALPVGAHVGGGDGGQAPGREGSASPVAGWPDGGLSRDRRHRALAWTLCRRFRCAFAHHRLPPFGPAAAPPAPGRPSRRSYWLRPSAPRRCRPAPHSMHAAVTTDPRRLGAARPESLAVRACAIASRSE